MKEYKDGEHPHDKLLGCIECGSCCQIAGLLMPKLRRMKADRTSKKDFTCRHLQEPNRCRIYDKRPIQCRAAMMPEQVVTAQKRICKYFHSVKKIDLQDLLDILSGGGDGGNSPEPV